MRVTRSLEKIKGKCMSSTQPLISVIVPIYNVEQYLQECVDSILAQTYTNLEIILVNDGSTDNCGKICDEYANSDSRVVVIHKKNGGPADARNRGIDAARGELLHFVDSDDWIENDMLELLYSNLINNDADISCCGYKFIYVNESKKTPIDGEITIFNSEQAIESFLYKDVPWNSACSKLYRKHIFESIRFPLNKRSEDIYIISDVMSMAKIIVYDSVPKYNYRQRKASRTNRNVYNPDIMGAIEAYENNLDVILKKYPKLVDLCEYRIIVSKISVLGRIISFENYKQIPEYEEVLKSLRENHKTFLGNINLNTTSKIALITIKINVNLYKLLRCIYVFKQKKADKEKFELFD